MVDLGQFLGHWIHLNQTSLDLIKRHVPLAVLIIRPLNLEIAVLTWVNVLKELPSGGLSIGCLLILDHRLKII